MLKAVHCHWFVANIDERQTAAQLFNHCWDLLEASPRTADQDADLLGSAFTSRHLFQAVGGPAQWITGDWMIARAAGAVGYGDLAVAYALRAFEAAQAPDTEDWLVASAAEGVARAYGDANDDTHRDEWVARAQSLVSEIADPENRDLIASQLAEVAR